MFAPPAFDQVRKMDPSNPLTQHDSKKNDELSTPISGVDERQFILDKPPVNAIPVRLYPELAAAALQTSQDKPLALWYALRAINTSGSGVLDYHRALRTLSEYAYTPGTARRHLREGQGRFWTIQSAEDGSSRIVIKSLLAVCQLLRVPRISWPVDLPAEAFRGLRKRRAAMYAAWLSLRGDRPISRERITEATGLQRRRQQRYSVVAGISMVPNYAFHEVGGRLVPVLSEYEGKVRSWWAPHQLPNTYVPNVTRTARGMTKRVNNALRQCCERADAMTSMERCYFESGTQAARAKNRAILSYVRAGRQPLARGCVWISV